MSHHLSPLEKCSLQVKIFSEMFSSSMSQKKRLKPKSLKLSKQYEGYDFIISEHDRPEQIRNWWSLGNRNDFHQPNAGLAFIDWPTGFFSWNGKSLKRMVNIFMYCISAVSVNVVDVWKIYKALFRKPPTRKTSHATKDPSSRAVCTVPAHPLSVHLPSRLVLKPPGHWWSCLGIQRFSCVLYYGKLEEGRQWTYEMGISTSWYGQ